MTNQERTECNTINAELDDMEYNLHGCDWCCGGGNERHTMLMARLKRLGGKRKPGIYGWWGLIEQWEIDYDKLIQERRAS